MAKVTAMVLGFCAALGLSQISWAADAGGKAAYEKACASCHGPDGKGNAAMTKAFGEKALNIATKEVAAKKDDELVKVIVEGKGKMPAAGKSLSKADQKAVVEYTRSLAK
ncbi:MAG TPA: cytochrome c [Candidatus Binatia bacterium]|jgi:cytochrome c oxidase subunit 2